MLAPHRKPCDTPQAHEPQAFPTRDTRWVLPATILGSSLSYIDESMVNVALPAMQRDLDVSFSTIQWVFNGYMLAVASLILLGGAAGDRFGRRRMFVVGLIGFGASTMAAGVAPSVAWLLAARFLQGVTAALLMPISLALIGSAYSDEARGRAIGLWAAAGALVIAVARPVGGWLIDAHGWRAIFFVNVPLALAALFCALRLRADPRRVAPERLDVFGTALAVATLGLLSFGLIALGEGRATGALAVAIAIPLLFVFIRTEARAVSPMMPLFLFRSREFSGANAVTFLYYAALTAVFFILPFMLVDVHGYSAIAAGAAFLPLSAFMVFGSRWTGSLVKSVGARAPLVLGSAVTLVGYVLLGVFGERADYVVGFLPGLLAVGAGVMLFVAPLTTTVLDAVPDENNGAASGINNAVDVAGGLVAVAALGLAFGGSSATGANAQTIANAFPFVMFGAAALAAASAVTAALTIGRRDGRGRAIRTRE